MSRLKDLALATPTGQASARAWKLRTRVPTLSPEVATPPGGAEGRRVLVVTGTAGHLTVLTMETVLAAALRRRGHDVTAIICDGVLPACLECTHQRLSVGRMATHGPSGRLCAGCPAAGRTAFSSVGVGAVGFGELVAPALRRECREIAATTPAGELPTLTRGGLAIGEHALAGALRYFARATLPTTREAEAILRRYVEAALISAAAMESALERYQPDVAVFNHGIYVPQGIVGEVCRARGVRVVNWNPGYRSKTFVFSHEDTYHHTLLDEPVDTWESLGWDEGREKEIQDYLESRWSGSRDWIWFHDRPSADVAAIEDEVGIDFSARPTIGLLTNVMWDAQLHYPANAFPTMLDWIVESVRYVASRPDLQLLVRVHPAEIRGSVPSKQLVVDELASAFPGGLPENVYVVPPDSDVSTYAAMAQCDTVLIFGTKTGVELTAMGIPVVVAGEAWIRGKGVTRDITSPEDYRAALDALPTGKRLDAETVTRARQYAYHFFFRRMIPVEFMRPTGGDPVFEAQLEGDDPLAPGRSRGLDVICDGIADGTPFVYPADEYGTVT